MLDWLFDLVDELFNHTDEAEEQFEPELPFSRPPSPNFTPKLRIRLENQRPSSLGSQIHRRPLPPRVPTLKRPVVPPLWHPSNPQSRFNVNNRQHPFNPYNPNNPHSVLNRNNPMNPNNPNGHHRPMNPFGPAHHR